MPSSTPNDRDDRASAPARARARWQQLQQALTRYLEARFRLFAEEARLAARSIAAAVAGIAIAAGLSLVAYLLLITSLLALLVHRLEWTVALAALVVAGGHVLVAGLLALTAFFLLRRSNKWFSHSLNELAADRKAFTRSDQNDPSSAP